LALSPTTAVGCGVASSKFGLSWSAPGNIELHSGLPDGPLIGQFGPTGTTILQNLPYGGVIFMVQPQGPSGPPAVLASTRATVTSDCAASAIAPLGVVNGASFSAASLAPASFATILGENLSTAAAQATGVDYPTTLAGMTVSLAGQNCPLSYVGPRQINFLVPSNIAPGRYLVRAGTAMSEVLITNASPGIFTLRGDGTGVPLGSLVAGLDDGSTVSMQPYECSKTGCAPASVPLPANATDLYVVLYGTGIRNYRSISASLGAFKPEVLYVGAHAQFPGLDQINLHLKAPFALGGTQTLQLQVDGIPSNAVSVEFQN